LLELGECELLGAGERVVVDAERTDVVVDDARATFAEGAEGQLGLERMDDLLHDDHVESSPDRRRDLGGHDYDSTRQADDERIHLRQRSDGGRQPPTGVCSIAKTDHADVLSGDAGSSRSAGCSIARAVATGTQGPHTNGTGR
jgi:hypothetical protein